MLFPIPNGTIQNIYSTKPRRTGAYILTNLGWIYTANPENYRTGLANDPHLAFPFWKTPDHMKVEN